MTTDIATALASFGTISLETLNAKAAMLERLDNKYIVPAHRLLPVLGRFGELFDVLEIEGSRAFTYATEYHDSCDAQMYRDHHQGRRKRCKVRVRTYLDAGYSFLEVKLKDLRDRTVKKRLRIETTSQELSPDALEFIDRCHQEIYGTPLGQTLRPVIQMRYSRMTLVAKEGGERMTIDASLSFRNSAHQRHAASDRFILETKSARGNGVADSILRGQHVHPTKRCSKYCMGMAALGLVERYNRFLPALKKLQVFEQPLRVRKSSKTATQRF
ncbi:polyphosphate polymerase domain-containing protein [uncultured Roseobacter sp.]|uniref:polyphosphate polymerase domain-containing protein n=1 Tax=uncultured Roseobacter sp. TaxID=114847 RepID=UPI00260FC924|nr:polyphosphate polymerase domain-containing protein [uncultured Roseobacter sp.]